MSDGPIQEQPTPMWDDPAPSTAGTVGLTLVEEQPIRFRFGIRGMILATALLGAFFALVNFFGALWAFLIATLVSMMAMCGVLVIAVSMRISQGPNVPASRMMIRLERINVWLIVASVVLTVGLVFAGGAKGVLMVLNRRALHAEWHKELGFRHTGRTVFKEGTVEDFLEITSVQPGGEFESVGIRSDEVIAMDEGNFFEMLENSRGESITITLGTGGASGQWEDFTTRQVTFQVPE